MLTNLHAAAIMIVFAGGPHTPERTALACELLASRPPPSVIYLTGAEYSGEYSNWAARVRTLAAALPTRPAVLTDTCETTWASCVHLAREMEQHFPKSKIQSPSRHDSVVLGNTPHLNPLPQGERKGGERESAPLLPLPSGERVGVRVPSLVSCPPSADILVITSNYHAPRARWLLSGILPLGGVYGLGSKVYGLSFFTSRDIPWRECFATPRNRQLVVGECISWLYCLPLGLIYHPLLLALVVLLLGGGILFKRRR